MAKQNFYKELNLRKQNLQRIELENIKKVQEAFQDLQDAFEQLKNAKEDAMEASVEASNIFGQGKRKRNELQELVDEAEDVANNTISAQIFLDESMDLALEAISNAEKVLPAFRKNADDLGLDADVVDEYREALQITGILNASEQEATSIYNQLDDDIDNVKEISNIQL